MPKSKQRKKASDKKKNERKKVAAEKKMQKHRSNKWVEAMIKAHNEQNDEGRRQTVDAFLEGDTMTSQLMDISQLEEEK